MSKDIRIKMSKELYKQLEIILCWDKISVRDLVRKSLQRYVAVHADNKKGK